MRISDWSSDVCSSDLYGRGSLSRTGLDDADGSVLSGDDRDPAASGRKPGNRDRPQGRTRYAGTDDTPRPRLCEDADHRRSVQGRRDFSGRARSEEHTSELQSLMRISYAVFCLKKKKDKMIHITNIQ